MACCPSAPLRGYPFPNVAALPRYIESNALGARPIPSHSCPSVDLGGTYLPNQYGMNKVPNESAYADFPKMTQARTPRLIGDPAVVNARGLSALRSRRPHSGSLPRGICPTF
jgi:hypothetical protein